MKLGPENETETDEDYADPSDDELADLLDAPRDPVGGDGGNLELWE